MATVRPGTGPPGACFSALQRAEIAEIWRLRRTAGQRDRVSVLFNEPKLLKSGSAFLSIWRANGFSALQRAEIAEIGERLPHLARNGRFQCSSTSRNC